MSCPGFLPRLTCSSCPAPALLFPIHLSCKSCPCCHVVTILSSLSCPGWPVRPNNPNRPVWAVLSYCYTPVVKSQVSCCLFRCPGPALILNRLSCLMSCPGCTGLSLHGFWKLRSNNKLTVGKCSILPPIFFAFSRNFREFFCSIRIFSQAGFAESERYFR